MKTSCDACGSSDANHIYEDHTHCYKCEKQVWFNTNGGQMNATRDTGFSNPIDGISSLSSYPISSRGISLEAVRYFNVVMDPETKSHYYPYTKNGKIVAYKERKVPKQFQTHGDFKNAELFGQAQATSGKTLVITEGELDTLAVAQAFLQHYKTIYSVVSIPSASNLKVLLEQRDWIRTFDKIILFFDNDDAGNTAREKAAKIIGLSKIKVVSYPEKDPSEVLISRGYKGIMETIWNATSYSPAGVIIGEQIWDEFKKRRETESIPYPSCLNGLNNKLKGLRHGEITLFTSGTGSGKSTVIKEIILDLLSKTEDKIGLISLEESVSDTASKFISMSLRQNIYLEDTISETELRTGFTEVFGSERLVLLDHQGSVSDNSLIDKIEYMALMGCKYLFLDHITIAVSEGTEGLEGNAAIDKVMSDLLKIVKKHNIWLGLISHLRKAMGGKSFEEGKLASIDDIKGSGSIKQISFDIISFSRNLTAESDEERSTIYFRVLKSRFTGLTGNAGSAVYSSKTCRLTNGRDIDVTI